MVDSESIIELKERVESLETRVARLEKSSETSTEPNSITEFPQILIKKIDKICDEFTNNLRRQAEKVFETIKNSLDRKFSIIIDLKGVSIMTVVFANICFGQLVGIFDYEFLRNAGQATPSRQDGLRWQSSTQT